MKDVLSQSAIAKLFFDFQKIMRGISAWLKHHDAQLESLNSDMVLMKKRMEAMEQFVLNVESTVSASAEEVEKDFPDE